MATKHTKREIEGWAHAMNRWRDQGTIHAMIDGRAACGARAFSFGGYFATAAQAGGNVCRRCCDIAAADEAADTH